MITAVKEYIESHIHLIEQGNLASVYLNCPLNFINDVNNTLHLAGIYYPSELTSYVVTCCYLSKQIPDIEIKELQVEDGFEEYTFITDYPIIPTGDRIYKDLNVLLPRDNAVIDVDMRTSFCTSRGQRTIKLRICR